MTNPLQGKYVADRINKAVPGATIEWNGTAVWVKPDSWFQVARFLKDTPDLDFAFLNSVTGVDYIEYFEVVYHLTSLAHNHSSIIKLRCHGREMPTVPSVVELWRGADLQEREVWDLMGVKFSSHPNLKRILLWEGFPGHPLRKDFLR